MPCLTCIYAAPTGFAQIGKYVPVGKSTPFASYLYLRPADRFAGIVVLAPRGFDEFCHTDQGRVATAWSVSNLKIIPQFITQHLIKAAA